MSKKLANITVIPEATDYHIKETDKGTEIVIKDKSGDTITTILSNFHKTKKEREEFTIDGETYDELGY
jgi:hypothetical protein